MHRVGKHPLVFGLALTLLIAAGLGSSAALAEEDLPMVPSPYVSDFTGPAVMHCYCILATSGCKSNFFWKAAGSPVHNWWQDVHLIKDKETDLVSACFRKRDVEGLGNELCCPVNEENGKPDEAMMKKFYGVSEVKPK